MDKRFEIGMAIVGSFHINNREQHFVSRIVEIIDIGCYRLNNGNSLYYHNMGLWLYGSAPWHGGGTRLSKLIALSFKPSRIVPTCATIGKAICCVARSSLWSMWVGSKPAAVARAHLLAKSGSHPLFPFQ